MNEEERRAVLIEIAAACGYNITPIVATPEETVEGIRQIKALEPGSELTDLQRRALLQNLRQAILVTACTERVGPIDRQAELPRWRFLRGASPQAADAYAAVLRYLQRHVPATLLAEVDLD